MQGPPHINQPQGAQTTKAGQRPSFSFTEPVVEEGEEDVRPKRSQVKKDLTKSMTVEEAKRVRQAAIKKKINEDYQKNRDPIKEFFQLVSFASMCSLFFFSCADLSVSEDQQSAHELDLSHQH